MIQIKMHDSIIRTLFEVRRVPDSKKNLIFLGALDSNGHRYTTESGVMRILKGALVVMKGKKIGKLYFLCGITLIDISVVSSLLDSDSDSTRLWHMRLGHIGE